MTRSKPRRRLALTLGALLIGLTPGCTIGKPIVGLFTGPYFVASDCDGCFVPRTHCGDPRGVVVAWTAVFFGAGPIGGLVTGAISDFNFITGRVDGNEWSRNFAHPFRTNTEPE